MKKKELKNLANKIAKAELIVQANEDPKKVHMAQEQILELCGHVQSLEDITLVDEMVQEILGQKI